MIEVRVSQGDADDAGSLEIYNAVFPENAFALEDAKWFKAGMVAADDHLAFLDGKAVGSALTVIRPHRRDVAFAPITVLAEHRRRGVGTALYDHVSRWAAERGVRELEASVEEDDAETIASIEKRGFREIERSGRMALDLTTVEPEPVAPPAGIEITTWAERPELARGIYDVASEASGDIPGQEEDEVEPFEDWLRNDMSGPGDRPEATFVALAGDEVVGFSKFALTRARPRLAYHDLTAVTRAWRGRGIAGALKRAQIAWAKSAGYERLLTSNEVRNAPIRKLNERLGYRPSPGDILFRGPISGAV